MGRKMFSCTMDASLFVAVAIPVGLGSLAGYLTRSDTSGAWYLSLKQPSWAPPRWMFGPVWMALYILMGIASWRVWKRSGSKDALTLYGIQLALNIAWSFLFFKLQSLKWALVDIVALLSSLVATVAVFYGIDHKAAYLMAPYLVWVTYATALNANLYLVNPS